MILQKKYKQVAYLEHQRRIGGDLRTAVSDRRISGNYTASFVRGLS